MTRSSCDKAGAAALGYALDLSAAVAAVRADRPDAPGDPVFALALCVLADLPADVVGEALQPSQAVLEGAAAHMHSQVRRYLLRQAIDDLINKARDTKGNPT